MDKNTALEILNKIKSSLANGKPSWYEKASAEEKAKFEDWNSKKVEAIEYAINAIICEDKLIGLRDRAHTITEFIDNALRDFK